ncbi:hypothetical protein PCANC_09698 [Puccinia coronata f. sp. avenae]|uniref:Retrotransposon gag domain-containing protein n=1 Tax=Puccinia coronata f. sp. avenae TaxID=200324 RepID=A0A2N5V7H3_9BASI|nr:hypothetical protein PCANC_09698 [Puccinia coronata f. sp. avenae]
MSSPGFLPDSPFIGPINTRIPLEQRVAQLSDQLSSLKINNSNQRVDLDSLFDELKKIKTSFDLLAEDIKDVNSMKTLYSDFVQLKLTFNTELVKLARSPAGATQDVPELQYAQFLGNPKETKRFAYFIREKLQEKGHLFPLEKAKINWIVCHFRNPNGHLGENVPSYNWWMALLFENARSQGLSTDSASTADPYVLEVLSTAKSFLAHLESVFNNKHDVEESKKRLFSFKQGNRTIEEFNALFNSLAYSVDLTEESQCDIYEQALNPKVLKIAVMRNDWKGATKLKEKQILAISAAEAQDKISSIDAGSLPSLHRQPPPPRPSPLPPPPPVRIPDGVVPMDLDNISSDTTFTFPKFRALCVQKGICQRCGQQFDEAHKRARGCVVSDSKHMDIKQKIELFRKWSSNPGQSVSQVDTVHPNLGQDPSPAPLNQVLLDQTPPLSLADQCLEQAIDEMDIESNPICSARSSGL